MDAERQRGCRPLEAVTEAFHFDSRGILIFRYSAEPCGAEGKTRLATEKTSHAQFYEEARL
jgi:hypothetical protein